MKLFIFRYLTLLASICFASSIIAQQISGRISNSKDNTGVSYASIGLIKANKGTTAFQDGSFKLDLISESLGDSLVFSCVGYQTLKVAIEKDRLTYDVTLIRKEL